MFIKAMSVLMLLNVSGMRLVDDLSQNFSGEIGDMIRTHVSNVEGSEMITIYQRIQHLSEPLFEIFSDVFTDIPEHVREIDMPATIVFTFSDDCSLMKVLVVHANKDSLDTEDIILYKGSDAVYKLHPLIRAELIKENGNLVSLKGARRAVRAQIINAERQSKRKAPKPFFEFLSGSVDVFERGGPIRLLKGDLTVPWSDIFNNLLKKIKGL